MIRASARKEVWSMEVSFKKCFHACGACLTCLAVFATVAEPIIDGLHQPSRSERPLYDLLTRAPAPHSPDTDHVPGSMRYRYDTVTSSTATSVLGLSSASSG